MTITPTTADDCRGYLGISRSLSIPCEIFNINQLLSLNNNNLLLKLVAGLTAEKRENVSSENGCTGICGGQVTNWLLTTCSVPTQFIPKPPNVQYIITHNLWVEILFRSVRPLATSSTDLVKWILSIIITTISYI